MLKSIISFAIISIALSKADEEKELNGKVALVTGGAQGIGLAIAENFLKEGVKYVIIVDKEKELGQQASDQLNAEYGENKTFFLGGHCKDDFDELTNKVIEKFGYIDILVNNAGLLDEYNPERVINTNVIALIKWSYKFHSLMRKDRGGKCGTILNISSIIGYTISPFIPEYTASKYAVIGYTRSLGHEYNYNNYCVRVISLNPGFTYTRMLEQQIVWDDHVEIFEKFQQASPSQTADCAGRAAVKVIRTADSGTSWDSINCEDPIEAPYSHTITAQELESL